MTSVIDTLKVKGSPALKNGGQVPPMSAPHPHRPTKPNNNNNSHSISFERTYQFVFKQTSLASEMAVGNYPYQSVPSRRMEHVSRVRAANHGISTMDSSYNYYGEKDTQFYVEKPHFVLCGLPMGSKDIDHHLYVNEARVGNYKTSAKAIYNARQVVKSGKAASEPAFPEKPEERPNTSVDDELGISAVPPIAPNTPCSPCKMFNKDRPDTSLSNNPLNRNTGLNNKTSDPDDSSVKLLVKHQKMTLMSRERSADNLALHRDHSSVSSRSTRTLSTVKDSVVNNSLTVTTGKRQKYGLKGKNSGKINYNNPYRNTKHRERLSLSGNQRQEFDNIDSYLQYQKQQSLNGKHIMTPRAILRIPNPCSDTFLLQMICDLNRPHSLRSGLASSKVKDIPRPRDIEEFVVQSRASSSMSKTHSNIDRFLGKKPATKSEKGSSKSVKSGSKSAKSMRSAIDGETIEEEVWDEGIEMDD